MLLVIPGHPVVEFAVELPYDSACFVCEQEREECVYEAGEHANEKSTGYRKGVNEMLRIS